ncbi:hypothetical protein [Methylosinus sp. Ce-a6]|uniref:hypothetical protein n=1 Tax=Methylosinus sp. Ce-a6 TaxID=2172005 RepID=UPI0013576BFA|nr:hypothetical protein [Methylosinus sp. Ce-a6]
MKSQTLPERLDAIAAKISLAAFVASSEDELGDAPRLGFYVLLSDAAEEIRAISNVLGELAQAEADRVEIAEALANVPDKEPRS